MQQYLDWLFQCYWCPYKDWKVVLEYQDCSWFYCFMQHSLIQTTMPFFVTGTKISNAVVSIYMYVSGTGICHIVVPICVVRAWDPTRKHVHIIELVYVTVTRRAVQHNVDDTVISHTPVLLYVDDTVISHNTVAGGGFCQYGEEYPTM